MDKLVDTLGVTSPLMSQVSGAAKEPDVASSGRLRNASTVATGPHPVALGVRPTGRESVAAQYHLVGAVLAEHYDEWAESRCYLGLDVLSKSRAELAYRTGGATTSPTLG